MCLPLCRCLEGGVSLKKVNSWGQTPIELGETSCREFPIIISRQDWPFLPDDADSHASNASCAFCPPPRQSTGILVELAKNIEAKARDDADHAKKVAVWHAPGSQTVICDHNHLRRTCIVRCSALNLTNHLVHPEKDHLSSRNSWVRLRTGYARVPESYVRQRH